MHRLRHGRFHPRALSIVIGLVAGHVILFYFLRHAGLAGPVVSGAVVSGVVLLMLAKHLGLLAAALRPLQALSRRRFPS